MKPALSEYPILILDLDTFTPLLMVQIIDHVTRVMTSVDLLQPSHLFF